MKDFFKKLSLDNNILGCSEDEIKSFEANLGITLPEIYVQFLLKAGRSAGNYMKGSDYNCKALPSLKDWANETLNDNNLPPLPLNAFVFWMHQGYQFAFFYLLSSNDPEVYGFDEVEKGKGIHKKFEHLSDFFNAQFGV